MVEQILQETEEKVGKEAHDIAEESADCLREMIFFPSHVKMSLARSLALQNNYFLHNKILDQYIHRTKGPEDSPCQATLTFYRIQASGFL